MSSKAVTVSSTFSLNAFSLAYGSSRASRAIALKSPKDLLPKVETEAARALRDKKPLPRPLPKKGKPHPRPLSFREGRRREK